MTCVVVQFMTQDVLAVGLELGVWACVNVDVVEPTGGAGGTKQAAWHDAACELQVIMHFVAVELCAKRILFVADASPAKPATAVNANRTAKHRIDCPYRS
ncbi:MAG TPA: hypothetical protein VNZ48_10715 [Xanthobacteraceae bacterium]|nr:hypothetical protein [Xanthobacteraceae bacterium]